jgi:hypothetical protein
MQLYPTGLHGITIRGGIMQSNGKSKDAEIFKDTFEKVKKWLREDGFTYGRSANQAEWAWILEPTDQVGFGLTIGQAAGNPQSLYLTVEAELDEYQKEIGTLLDDAKKDLVFSLRQRLLLIGAAFEFSERLSSIKFKDRLFTDTLTRESFWNGVNRLRRALDCMTWTLDEKLPMPSPFDIGSK